MKILQIEDVELVAAGTFDMWSCQGWTRLTGGLVGAMLGAGGGPFGMAGGFVVGEQIGSWAGDQFC